jgi:imidazolonepropionase
LFLRHREVALTKKQADLTIAHANQLVTVKEHSARPAVGREMAELGVVEDGAVAVTNGKIIAAGKSTDVLSDYDGNERMDASGKVVTPGFVDAHTHLVFAGSRERELELKIQGAGYMKILQEGGGILSTVRETRKATKDELLEICKQRCKNMMLHGTTTAEAKSGYGLTLADEIKCLEVIQQLSKEGPVSLAPTFLGAHAVPPEYQGKTHEYADLICETWIPEVAARKLAGFCDVFCEKDVFEIEDSRKILMAGREHGLAARIHADEFYPLGGAELAAEVGAISADHLLHPSPAGLTQMKAKSVIATLLPAAPLTLMVNDYADARRIISEGIPVALGSDLSPSCWLENFQLVIQLACYKLKMTPAEALTAATINAAHSIQKANEVGSIETGKRANMLVLGIPEFRFLAYRIGSNLVDTVLIDGKIVARDGRLT